MRERKKKKSHLDCALVNRTGGFLLVLCQIGEEGPLSRYLSHRNVVGLSVGNLSRCPSEHANFEPNEVFHLLRHESLYFYEDRTNFKFVCRFKLPFKEGVRYSFKRMSCYFRKHRYPNFHLLILCSHNYAIIQSSTL